MSAAATVERRQTLRNAGKRHHYERPHFEPHKVYRSSPLYRQRKARPNAMHHLYLWLGALVGVVLAVGAMAVANWVLVALYGLGF